MIGWQPEWGVSKGRRFVRSGRQEHVYVPRAKSTSEGSSSQEQGYMMDRASQVLEVTGGMDYARPSPSISVRISRLLHYCVSMF